LIPKFSAILPKKIPCPQILYYEVVYLPNNLGYFWDVPPIHRLLRQAASRLEAWAAHERQVLKKKKQTSFFRGKKLLDEPPLPERSGGQGKTE